MAYGDPTLYKGYLGGHNWITHTDEGAIKYLKEKFSIKTMLDVGCGPGGQVRVAKSLGIDAEGVDGDDRLVAENTDITINVCDYTKDSFIKDVDLIWSTEFLEHVEEKYQENYMKTFCRGKHAFITFAPPGKHGTHHVNLKPKEYWIDVFEKYGFTFDYDVTNEVKRHSTMKREFVRDNGLYFRNKD